MRLWDRLLRFLNRKLVNASVRLESRMLFVWQAIAQLPTVIPVSAIECTCIQCQPESLIFRFRTLWKQQLWWKRRSNGTSTMPLWHISTPTSGKISVVRSTPRLKAWDFNSNVHCGVKRDITRTSHFQTIHKLYTYTEDASAVHRNSGKPCRRLFYGIPLGGVCDM